MYDPLMNREDSISISGGYMPTELADKFKIPDFYLKNDNILVSELCDDLTYRGVVTVYDSDSPYMFCKVEMDNPFGYNRGDIVVIKRYAKEEFISGLYFISPKDVRCVVPEIIYSSMVV